MGIGFNNKESGSSLQIVGDVSTEAEIQMSKRALCPRLPRNRVSLAVEAGLHLSRRLSSFCPTFSIKVHARSTSIGYSSTSSVSEGYLHKRPKQLRCTSSGMLFAHDACYRRFPPRQGVDMTFAACALGHHLLAHLLKPSRVVTVTGDIYCIVRKAIYFYVWSPRDPGRKLTS